MKVLQVSTNKVKPYNKNPRFNEDAISEVMESIKEFGFQQPIVVDKNMVVIVGHTRLLAAKELKLKTVPIVVAENLSPKKVKAYRIADNKTAEFSKWDFSLLKNELESLDGEFTGFSEAEIDGLTFGFTEEDTGLEDETEEEEQEEGLHNQVKLVFLLDGDARDKIVKKLNAVKQKNELETLSDAFVKLILK